MLLQKSFTQNPFVLPVHPSAPPSLATTHLFSVSRLASPECHVVGNTHRGAFAAGSFHSAMCRWSSSSSFRGLIADFFLSLYRSTTVYPFDFEARLGCFSSLALRNQTAVGLFVDIRFHLLGKNPWCSHGSWWEACA